MHEQRLRVLLEKAFCYFSALKIAERNQKLGCESYLFNKDQDDVISVTLSEEPAEEIIVQGAME